MKIRFFICSRNLVNIRIIAAFLGIVAFLAFYTPPADASRIISLSGDLDFGNVSVGSSAERFLTISNAGDATITVTGIDYGSNPGILLGGFSGNWSGAIVSGGSQNVPITFSPGGDASNGNTNGIPYLTFLSVESDATDGTNFIALSGTGIPVPLATRILSLGTNLNFSGVEIGSTAQLSLVISNGGGSTLTISNITFPEGFSGNFSSSTLGASATTNLTVTFLPSMVTTYGGAGVVISDATGGGNIFILSGAGTFSPKKSSYEGLFYSTNDLEFDKSGYFSATTENSGAFSAKIRLGGKDYPFAGRFSTNGLFSGSIVRRGLSDLGVSIQSGLDGGTAWKGVITDGTWAADLWANHSTFDKKTNPAPQTGTYTVTIDGSDNALLAPTNKGEGTIVITASGIASVKMALGDGTKVSQKVPLSKEGRLPFFGSLYSGRGSILGWIYLTNGSGYEMSGIVNWFKPTNKDPNLPNGFFLQTPLSGSQN